MIDERTIRHEVGSILWQKSRSDGLLIANIISRIALHSSLGFSVAPSAPKDELKPGGRS